jgi:hypothetical protein
VGFDRSPRRLQGKFHFASWAADAITVASSLSTRLVYQIVAMTKIDFASCTCRLTIFPAPISTYQPLR